MAEDRVTLVFEAKGGENVRQQLVGVASALSVTQKDANRATADIRDLKKYLEFAGNTKSATEFTFAMKKVEQITNRLKDKSIKGLKGGLEQLNTAERQRLSMLQKQYDATKKNVGITNSFTQGIKGAIPALGMMATGVGAITLIGQKLIRMFDQAVTKVKEFIESTMKLGGEQEEGRLTMQAMVGDIAKGTAAYDEFDARVTDSPFKGEIYNVESYASAVGKGLGKAYLDAAEAGDRLNFSADSMVDMLVKLDTGMLRSAQMLAPYKELLDKAGISFDDIKNKTISYSEVSDRLKVALHDLAAAQREAIGKSWPGMLRLIKNQWGDIKEAAGEFLNNILKPIARAILDALKEGRNFKELWAAVKAIMKDGILPAVAFIISNIKIAVWWGGKLNDALGWLHERLEPGITAMTNFRNLIRGASTDAETLGKVAENSMNIMLELSKGPLAWDLDKVRRLREENAAYAVDLRQVGAERAAQKEGQRGRGAAPGEPPGPAPGKPGKPVAPLPSAPRALYGTLLELPALEGATGDEQARVAGQKLAGLEGRRGREKTAGELKELEDRYGKIAKKTGGLMADFFQSALKEGGITDFFKGLGLSIATTLTSALATSAVFTVLMRAAGGGGGFWNTFKGMLGFEQEGTFANITTPRAVIIHPGESIFNQDTIAAFRAGGSPRGGRPGYEYGPETYGGAAAPVVHLTNVIRPGVNAEIDTYRMAEQGRALAEMADA